jgi:uncharacterized protein (TIGR02996 family)
MHAETPFLEAIRAAPTDVASRLVYADWLEERGDARGALIRLQEEMNGLPAWSDRYWSLKPRRDSLRAQITNGWLQTMGYVPTYRPLFSKLPAARHERWRLVREFIELWDQPLAPQSGNTEAELRAVEEGLGNRLPEALREWYLLAGKQTRIWSWQDRLCPLHELQIEDGRLIFRWENQGCETWGVRLEDFGQDDPPVYKCREERTVESPTVTAFAIVSLLMETIWTNVSCSNDGANFSALSAEVAQKFVPCDLPTSYWACNPVYFYEGKDLYFVESHVDGFLYVPARDESAYEQLSPAFREQLVQTG